MSESGAVPEFLSVAQVAKRLGCSVSLVQKWRRLGWLPATRLGPPDVPVYGYRPADVDRFARERWNRQRGRPALQANGQPARLRSRLQAGSSPPAPAGTAADGSQPAEAAGQERFKPPQLQPVDTVVTVKDEAGRASAAGSAAPAEGTSESSAPAERAAPASPAGPEGPTGQRPAAGPGTPEIPAMPAATGRPLVLWDGDPREGTPLVLARFPASDLDAALGVAAVWARRYDDLVLGEATGPGNPPHVLARWRRGEPVPA